MGLVTDVFAEVIFDEAEIIERMLAGQGNG